ncbi:hypothetical protein ACM66B_007108 [Microbotryomycetes sp. NB124-2]
MKRALCHRSSAQRHAPIPAARQATTRDYVLPNIALPPLRHVHAASLKQAQVTSSFARPSARHSTRPGDHDSHSYENGIREGSSHGDQHEDETILPHLSRKEVERALYTRYHDDKGASRRKQSPIDDNVLAEHREHVYHDVADEPIDLELGQWLAELQSQAREKKVKTIRTTSKKASTVVEKRQKDEKPATTAKTRAKAVAKDVKAAKEAVKAKQKQVQADKVAATVLSSRPSNLETSPIKPYRAPSRLDPNEQGQPYAQPLLSRNDWRLSAPLSSARRRKNLAWPISPPSLYEPLDLTHQGHNKLVGIGIDSSKVGSWSSRMRLEEQWGWKMRVPAMEKQSFPAADVHRKRLDRLIQLSAEAEEKFYIEQLAKAGPPWQRELQGKTVCRARGQWLTDSLKIQQIMSDNDKKTDGDKASTNASVAKAIAAWWHVDGKDLGPDAGFQFEPGSILRFTPLSPPTDGSMSFFQGDLIDVRDGQLIVAFEETDVWLLGEEEYRIDIGNDDTSYKLQSRAIDNLYFDPERQRKRNADVVEAAQLAHLDGITTTLREWALQGTDLRDLVVPSLDKSRELDRDRTAQQDPQYELFDGDVTQKTASEPASNPSSLFADNQLINSWIKRHARDDPIKMTGDPDLGLNESQTKAVAMALGQSLSLIQGPPGTGKSATIVSMIALVKLHFRIPQPILLTAPTHVSVDHLLSLLIKAGLNPLRTGKVDKVRSDLQEWTVEKRREGHPLWQKLEQARESSETSRVELQDFKDELTSRAGGTRPTKQDLEREVELETKYRKSWRKYIALEHRLYSSLFASVDVFCSTAIGAGASKVMNMVDFPIVFLDEAAMCTEPVSLIPIMKGAQHVTFIGDHKQLPAVVKSRDAVKERLHVSLFERLMVDQTVQSTLLDTQYRMTPTISAFPNEAFYTSMLKNSTCVQSRPSSIVSQFFPRQDCPTVFLSHSAHEEAFRQSTMNSGEAEIIVQVVGDLLARNPSLRGEDIGVITPYFAQTRLLQDMFGSSAGRSPNGSRSSSSPAQDVLSSTLRPDRVRQVNQVEINTVDGFQGREKSVIILSTVRSNRSGFIGFLSDKRRLNVALTRAKDGLVVVGNAETLIRAASGSGLTRMSDDGENDPAVWKKYIEWMDERGLVRSWDEPVSFAVAEEGVQEPDAATSVPDVDEWLVEEHGGQNDVDSRDLYI